MMYVRVYVRLRITSLSATSFLHREKQRIIVTTIQFAGLNFLHRDFTCKVEDKKHALPTGLLVRISFFIYFFLLISIILHTYNCNIPGS